MKRLATISILLIAFSVNGQVITAKKNTGKTMITNKNLKLVKALSWKSLPTSRRVELKYCETPSFRVVTTGGTEEINIEYLSAAEKDRPDTDQSYSTTPYPRNATYNWDYRRITALAQTSMRANTQRDTATVANSPAVDTTFEIRVRRAKKPLVFLSNFGAFIGSVKGKIELSVKDGGNNAINTLIRYQYKLDNNLVKLDSPTINKTTNKRYESKSKVAKLTYEVFFSASYNRGCSGKVDDRVIRIKLVDPRGEQVRMNSAGLMAEFIPKSGHYTATAYTRGGEIISRPIRFKVLN